MKLTTLAPLVFGIPFLFAGCTQPAVVHTESLPEGTQMTQDDYSIEIDPVLARNVDFGPHLQEAVREDIEYELDELGYHLTDADEADFKVIFSTYTEPTQETAVSTTSQVRQRQIVVKEMERRPGPGGEIVYEEQPRVVTTSREEPMVIGDASRLFVIDVVDTDSGKLVWRGYTRQDNTRLSAETISNEIDNIFEAFPYTDGRLDGRGR